MQTIDAKLSRIAAVIKAAGLTADQARHLIHGTGGSPRRARRAIRLGIHMQLIDAYAAALAEGGSHTQAVIRCNALYLELVPSAPAAGPNDETDGDDGAAEEAAAAVTKAAAKPSKRTVAAAIASQAGLVPDAKPAKRIRKAAAAPAAKLDAAGLKALLPATV